MADYCPCGGIILADTEDWKTPRCYECWEKLGSPEKEPELNITVVDIPGPSRELKGRWPKDFVGKPSPLKDNKNG